MTAQELRAYFEYVKQAVNDGRLTYEQARPLYRMIHDDVEAATKLEQIDLESRLYHLRMGAWC